MHRVLSLYDSKNRALSAVPKRRHEVGMYVCGPTVYQRAHIGNARPFVIFSWLKQWLEAGGRRVTFVHNITDVNDKIYEAAPDASAELATRAAGWYMEDIGALGVGMPDAMPKVTECMPEIVSLISRLVDSGHAYESGGDVYFRVSSYRDYGSLSGRTGRDLDNAEPSALKDDPRDFAMWKATKPGEDTHWPSPWGPGRPGWHIECSAMALKHLGSTFDIHGGGIDLLFPHHENEEAQSRSAGDGFARIWMHNGMLEFAGEKMSKSLGNAQTIREALNAWGRETLLALFLGTHWHSPMEYSPTTLRAAAARLDTLVDAAHTVPAREAPNTEWGRVAAVLDESFNTPAALAIAHEWMSKGYHDLAARLLSLFGLGNIVQRIPVPEQVRDLARRRAEARIRKDFETADRLRATMGEAGWTVRDAGEGSELVPTHRVFRVGREDDVS